MCMPWPTVGCRAKNKQAIGKNKMHYAARQERDSNVACFRLLNRWMLIELRKMGTINFLSTRNISLVLGSLAVIHNPF